MEINLQGGVRLPQALPGARSVDFPVVKQQENAGSTAVADTKAAEIATEVQRLERLQQAAENVFKDVYAVSDTKFSIFKDLTGQYITRFTNLRDGKVTYIPEPQLLKRSASYEPRQLVELKA